MARIGWFVARLATPILQSLQQSRLFAQYVAAGRHEDLDVEAVAQDAPGARIVQGELHRASFGLVLVAHVHVALRGAGHECGETHTLDDEVGQLLMDHAILEGARLALVGVADHVLRSNGFLANDLPFQPGGESRPAHAA